MAAQRNITKELKILLENSPLGIVLTDTQGKFLYTNRSFQEMLGYTEEEMLSKTVFDITHPDCTASSYEAIKEAFTEQKYVSLEKKYLHKNGEAIDAITRIATVVDEDGNTYQCTNIENISEHKRIEQKLIYLATHDELTGILNRREFEQRAEALIKNSQEHGYKHILLFMDLDQFKTVNDTCGHAAGDILLCELSTLLKNKLRARDTFARLGGDEFGILVEHCTPENASRIIDTIKTAVQDYAFKWNDQVFTLDISIGMAAINKTSHDLQHLIAEADGACYQEKKGKAKA